MIKSKNIPYLRHAFQLIFFLLLVLIISGSFCAFSLNGKQVFICPVGAMQLTIASRTLITGVIVTGMILLILTILLGRAFCSWACPFGAILDGVQYLLSRIRTPKKGRPSFLTQRHNKYGLLGGILIAAGILRIPVFCTVCPLGTTCRSAGLQGINAGLETAVIPVVAGLEIFQKRFFCKYFCPLGGLLSLVDKLSFHRIKLPAGVCLKCGRCEKACSMDIKPMSNTYGLLKKDPAVLSVLLSAGQPDILDKPVPWTDIPLSVRKTLEERSTKFTVPPGECTRCHECSAACPVLREPSGRASITSPHSTHVT